VGSQESPTVNGLRSQQLKSGVVCVRLLKGCMNARAAASPLTDYEFRVENGTDQRNRYLIRRDRELCLFRLAK